MSKSYLDGTGVGTLSSLMKKEIKDTVESTKEQLFVVTVTSSGSQPEERDDGFSIEYTPSATFEEAVAQVKSGKKVIIGRGDDLGTYVQMHYVSGPNLLLSDDKTSFLIEDENIKTFNSLALQHFQWSGGGLVLIVSKTLPSWIKDTKPTYAASEVGADKSGAATQALTDAKEWVTGKGYQTASEVKAAIESAKEQLFVVTVTPKEEPPTEDEDSTIYSCTPSVTFEEAVAQVKSGKKVVVRVEHLGDFQMRYESSPNLLISDDEFYLSHDQNIKTFHPFISQHFQWSKGGLILITYNMLPKWIGDTKPTYTASEVGAATKPKRVSVTLTASDWDTNKKTQTVTVMGVSADESAQVIQPIPALASRDGYNTFGIRAISQAKNSITFIAGIIPASDLNVYIVITEVTA